MSTGEALGQVLDLINALGWSPYITALIISLIAINLFRALIGR